MPLLSAAMACWMTQPVEVGMMKTSMASSALSVF
jgi:hypothetical protein